MGAMRRHPLYTSWVAFILMVGAVSVFSPAGDLLVPAIGGVIAIGLAVSIYVVLARSGPRSG